MSPAFLLTREFLYGKRIRWKPSGEVFFVVADGDDDFYLCVNVGAMQPAPVVALRRDQCEVVSIAEMREWAKEKP